MEAWRSEVAARHKENRHLMALVDEPWFEAMLQSPGCGKLWCGSRRRLLKELSESYALLVRMQHMRGGRSQCGSGEGTVLFDVCSGKGFTALMLSHAFPAARVVMIDSDPVMNMSHTRRLPNVEFKRLDLFSTQCIDIIQQAAQGATWACAFGMHLCGALSPRLISIFGAIPELDGLVLSPCCLKGFLGKQCQLRAKQQRKDPYDILCRELLVIAREMVGGTRRGTEQQGEVAELLFDTEVLSAKNGFLLCARDANVTSLEEAQAAERWVCGICDVTDDAVGETACFSPWMHV